MPDIQDEIPELEDQREFSFDELDDDAKDRAVERLAESQLDYEWWDHYDDEYITSLLPDGVVFKTSPGAKHGPLKSFDLDRGDIELDGDFEVVDGAAYSRLLGFPDQYTGVPGIGIVPFKKIVDAGVLEGNALYDDVDFDSDALHRMVEHMIREYDATDEDFGFERPNPSDERYEADLGTKAEAATDYLMDRLHESVERDQGRELMREWKQAVLSSLRRQHEYLTSRESIEENIRANEYKFDREGNLV